MAELNEHQLGLLNSLIYLDSDYSPGKPMHEIIAEIRGNGVLERTDIGGGLTKEDAEDLLDQIEGDEALMKLKVDSAVNTEIRGICFVDTDTNEATIAFRGTGPAYAAWDDNCQGGYLSDTDMQREALRFAQDCAERYDDITVSGHSKGGNMAQYVTVLMGDSVDRCVSFDGQGFGDEFLLKYAQEIAKNRDKIRSVCAHNDFVNILLFPIAGEIVYLENAGPLIPQGHYLHTMISNPKNKLVNGEYQQTTEQHPGIVAIKTALNTFVIKMDVLDTKFKEYIVYTIVGAVMGAIMTREDVDINKIFQEIMENMYDFLENHIPFVEISWLIPGLQRSAVNVTVDTEVLRSYGVDLISVAGTIDLLRTKIEQIQKRMASNLIDGVSIGLPLRSGLVQLEKECAKLNKLGNALIVCADLYNTTEKEIRSYPNQS